MEGVYKPLANQKLPFKSGQNIYLDIIADFNAPLVFLQILRATKDNRRYSIYQASSRISGILEKMIPEVNLSRKTLQGFTRNTALLLFYLI